jgi:hypothetical protein
MFRKRVFAIAMISASVALSTRLSSAWHSSQRFATIRRSGNRVALGLGFAGWLFNRFTRNHGGYGADRRWDRDNCFPIEPGRCNGSTLARDPRLRFGRLDEAICRRPRGGLLAQSSDQFDHQANLKI